MMPKSQLLIVLIALLVLPVLGCDQSGPPPRPEGVKVSGKVLLPNGSHLSGGQLLLHPQDGLYWATADVNSDGTFTLQDSGRQDIVPGQYHVFLRFPDSRHAELRHVVSERYQASSEEVDSDLVVEINEPTDNLVIRLNY